MLVEQFNQLRKRVEGLRAGQPAPITLGERLRSVFFADDGLVDLGPLTQLGADLAAAGVHTTADARLLKEVSAHHQRLQTLAQGLQQRATQSFAAMDLAVREAERLFAAEKLPPALLRELTDALDVLTRIVKVAAVFSGSSLSQRFEVLPGARRSADLPPVSPRLAAAEYFAERARQTVEDLASRKRDLDLAHELLLQLGTNAKDDHDRLRRVRVEVADARERVREVPTVRTLGDTVKHVRHVARNQPAQAYRSLKSLYERAVEAGDARLAEAAHEALTSFLPGGKQLAGALERSEAQRALPTSALPPGGQAGVHDLTDDALAELAFDLSADKRKALELAAGCSRFFDIEDALSKEVIEAEQESAKPKWRRVSYPTQHMTYEFTNSLDELHNFVITQPGMVLLDLAANKQQVRSYLTREESPSKKKQMQTAVRVYVLDASGSMFGARAKFRDAILMGELNGLRVRSKLGIPFDPLYFTFFNDVPTDLTRVDSAEQATRVIEKLFAHSPADGQTDITLALISAFDSIRAARGRDPYLARATIVLVTDGEDGVELELIRKLRKPLQEIEVSLSFISLGDENADLKALMEDQRLEGKRAFYHHLTDAEIKLAPTEFDSSWRSILPSHLEVTPEALAQLLPQLEALEAIAQNRPPPSTSLSAEQFDAFFPENATPTGVRTEQLTDLLNAVAEAASLAPADDRPREAVDLLIHLLKLYGIALSDYRAALSGGGTSDAEGALVKALQRVRLLCKPWA